MTAQIGERLLFDGEEVVMAICPPLPRRYPGIVKNDDEKERNEYRHTACWRGYQGTWEIREERLYLVSLAGGLKLLDPEPLLADWFTGTLRIPRGDLLTYVHMGFGSVFEEELHLKIDRGVVSGQRVFDQRDQDRDTRSLGWQNLPGFHNRFEGDGRPVGRAISRLIGGFFRRLFG